MFSKIPINLVFMFLGSSVISVSVAIENEIQITKLVERIVAEKTSELSNKVLILEHVVMNQQIQIDRLEKQEKRKERTIMNIVNTITEMRQEITLKKIKTVMAEDDNSVAKSDSQIRNNGSRVPGLKVSTNSENDVSTAQQIKHEVADIKTRGLPQAGGVAFSVYLSHTIDNMGDGHHIVFDKVLTNDGGGYNSYTGIFTVPVTGVYLFTFSIDDHYHYSMIQLVVDGTNIIDIVDHPVNTIESMSSNTAIIRVSQGQSVWLQEYIDQDGSIFSSNNYRYCTFSGVILY